jgi:hypothetical protein
MTVKSAFFSGKRWRVVTDEEIDGYADAPEFEDGRRELWIHPALEGQRRLETCVHEALHACLPGVCEQAVDGTARDVARFLWRLGYRLK